MANKPLDFETIQKMKRDERAAKKDKKPARKNKPTPRTAKERVESDLDDIVSSATSKAKASEDKEGE